VLPRIGQRIRLETFAFVPPLVDIAAMSVARSVARFDRTYPRFPGWLFPITIDNSTTGAGRRILPCSSAVPRAVVLYRPDLVIENLSRALSDQICET
jgi:hypothetical protein